MSTSSISPDSAPLQAEQPSGVTLNAEPPANHSSSTPPKAKKKHKAHIAHKVSGRIRMKIPSGKANPEILESYKKIFSAIPGILEIKTKPETGSIVINYDPKRESQFNSHFHEYCTEHEVSSSVPRPGDEVEEMAKQIEAEAEFLAERSHLVRLTVDLFKGVDYQIKAATGNTIDFKIVLAGGLAVATFAQIGAETATPMWVTLALFGVNHFIDMNHHTLPAKSPTTEPAADR